MTNIDNDEKRKRIKIIVDQWDGIFAPYEAFYIHSIICSAERSDRCFSEFDKLIVRSGTDTDIFASAQEALTHAGALSRFFWPIKSDDILASKRGSRLRQAFGINDTSPLKWRRLRNAFEHYDEDLDRYLLGDFSGFFFPTPIVGDVLLTEEPTGRLFKLIDPENGICVLLGQKFEFSPIRTEVNRILELARDMDKNGSRLPRAK